MSSSSSFQFAAAPASAAVFCRATGAFRALLVAAAIGLGLSALAADAKVEQIAIVAPETEADHGWNQQGLQGAADVAKALELKLNVHDNVGYDDIQTILKQVAEAGNDLVIAHASGFTTAAARAAEETGVPMLAVFDGDDSMLGPKLGMVDVAGQEAGYLGGVAAAAASQDGKLGLVLSAEDLYWYQMSGGFIQGARSINPDVKIILSYVGPNAYADSAAAKRVTEQLIALGVDVIMGMGNGATVGYIAAVEEAQGKVKYISTVGSVDDLVSRDDVVLTGIAWNFQTVYRQAIEGLQDGSFGQKAYAIDLANDGFTVLDTPNLDDAVREQVEQARRGILSGDLQVQRISDKDRLRALLDKK